MSRSTLSWLLAAIAVLLPSLASSNVFAAKDAAEFTQRDSEALLKLGGVWRSRGYGWLWSIEGNRVTTYDHAPGLCIERRVHRGLPDDAGDTILLSRDRRTARFPMGDPTYHFTFERLDTLPSTCRRPADTSALGVYDAAVSIFSTHYAFFAQRNIDWPARAADYRRRLDAKSGEQALFTALSGLLSKIDDGHVTMEAEVDGRTVKYNPDRPGRTSPPDAVRRAKDIGFWTRDIGARLVEGRLHSYAGGRVEFGVISGDIGFLYLGSTGYALRDAIRAGAIAKMREVFAGKRALVIDISKNFGGADYVARRFASLFTRKRVLGYYKYAGDAAGDVPQPVHIEPTSGPLLFDGPIYLITSRTTISAAEILVMALRALPNVTHLGADTRGSLSDVLTKPLPNGWSVTLSNEIYLDADRKGWEGKGIPPDIAFVVARDPRTAYGRSPVEAARGLMNYISTLPKAGREGRASPPTGARAPR